MITTTEPDNYPIVDPQEVTTDYDRATAAMLDSTLARLWSRTQPGRRAVRVLATVPELCAEIGRLRARLTRTLTDLHNMIAAARATLGAQRDGETDPLYYLRDELHAQGHLPPDEQEHL